MSGGHFDYVQHRFENEVVKPFAEELREIEEYRLMTQDEIDKLPDEKQWYVAFARSLKHETIKEFRKGLVIMRAAAVFAQRIDWFLSDDDGEQSFHERLEEELEIALISERNITRHFLPNPEQVVKVFDARSQYCRCVYAVGYDNDGYEDWKTIYTIETQKGYRRQHHADRMIQYLKNDFYGKMGSSTTLNSAATALMKKHGIHIYTDNDKPYTIVPEDTEQHSQIYKNTAFSNEPYQTKIEKP